MKTTPKKHYVKWGLWRWPWMFNFGKDYYDGPIWFVNCGPLWINIRNYPW